MNRRDFLRGVAAAGAVCAAGSLSAWADADTDVRTVYLVNKCHLDLGYTNFQHKILRTYFDDFIPHAIDTSQNLAQTGATERYCWTLGSWMIQEYLAQASPSAAKRFEQAIADGQIAWHALPFTWQTEMLDRSLIETSLGISKALDKRFGKTTTAGKLTDVMGHSRGIIAPLVDAGVNFLHIGPNGSCRYPDFPAPFFRWRDKSGNELIVMYATDYGGTERLPGSPIAVSMNVRADNTGPHTVQEVKDHYAWLKSRYPNAQIISGNLSAAGNALQPYLKSLPVVTQEFGDSWIYGVASDPKKVANYRELCRLRQEWIASGKMTKGAAVDLAMTSRLILGPEHNWGLSFHQIFPWNDLYTPTQLREASVRGSCQ
ncbi:MAG: DUF5054 domain-containing protein [Capsulimonas sp.]|uniref:DUF5054 domain-containing protein n=1 Tax=Capsulimonas sp. TaxID=2494211 RepID=UPI0032665966